MIRTGKAIVKNRIGMLQYPSFITLFVTWRCNAKCIMCDIWKKKDHDELSVGELDRIFSQLEKIDAIRISGGEPFLRTDLSEIVNLIDRHVSPNILHITTNGFLTTQIVETMKKVRAAKKVHLKISIDDIGEKHDRIRGVPKAFEMAMESVSRLSKLRDKKGFYLGVNQTIVDEEGMKSYAKLRKELSKYNVKVHPVIAYKQETSLYSGGKSKTDVSNSYKPYGKFENRKLAGFLKKLISDSDELDSFEEKAVKKYFLRGLYNRLIKRQNKPNPRCVALRSHLRILPNGDVPVCMYNSTVVGNLRKERFRHVWFSKRLDRHRKWVAECEGCWAGCESNVNAIYTGDIWRGMV
jgi:MoaA/NifB/PqqE/SkfB family radical SAM enzyme